MSLQPFGWNEGAEHFSAIADNFKSYLIQTMREWINELVVPRSKTKAPVHTGNLRDAIALIQIIDQGETIVFIVGWGPQAPYGQYQERGWKTHPGKEFILSSIQEAIPDLSPRWIKQIKVQAVSSLMGKTNVKTITFTA